MCLNNGGCVVYYNTGGSVRTLVDVWFVRTLVGVLEQWWVCYNTGGCVLDR